MLRREEGMFLFLIVLLIIRTLHGHCVAAIIQYPSEFEVQPQHELTKGHLSLQSPVNVTLVHFTYIEFVNFPTSILILRLSDSKMNLLVEMLKMFQNLHFTQFRGVIRALSNIVAIQIGLPSWPNFPVGISPTIKEDPRILHLRLFFCQFCFERV